MRQAIENTGWPLVTSYEASPLRAGSVVLYSHNLFHRGNHRRDDWQTWKNNPRFMWRFWLYRTTHPQQASTSARFEMPAKDEVMDLDIGDATEDVKAIWRHQFDWIRFGEMPGISADESDRGEASRLFDQIQSTGDAGEPLRVGAAYRLAALEDGTLATEYLGKALVS